MKYIRIWAREYGVQYTECCIYCYGPECKEHVITTIPLAFLPDKNNVVCYFEEKHNDIAMAAARKRYFEKEGYEKFMNAFHKYGKEYVDCAKRISEMNLSKISNGELIKCYREYVDIWIVYSAYIWLSFFISEFYAQKGKEMLDKKGRKIETRVHEALFSPSKRAGILELKDKLLKFKKNGAIPNSKLKELLEEYKWISTLDMHDKMWTEKDISDFYETLKIEEKPMDFNQASEIAGLNEEEIEFFRKVKETAYVKDERDVYRRKGVFYIIFLYEEIAKRLGLTRRDLSFFLIKEIIKSLEKGKSAISRKEIDGRMRGFLLYRKDGEVYVTSDPNEIAKFRKENEIEDYLSNEIKGIVANKGIAKGIARVVTSVNDLKKVQKGDVMVSITTHPDFISAMQKASAFVTDEGGLMCHAAIVGREMNKPCIVGSKSATRLIKDGDLVEVDADEGVVRVIK